MRPHRRQPTRLPCPWDSPGKNMEQVSISFSNAWKWKVKVKSLSLVQPSATPWTAAFQAPPSMGFSRQEYWSGVPLQIVHSNILIICHKNLGRVKKNGFQIRKLSSDIGKFLAQWHLWHWLLKMSLKIYVFLLQNHRCVFSKDVCSVDDSSCHYYQCVNTETTPLLLVIWNRWLSLSPSTVCTRLQKT